MTKVLWDVDAARDTFAAHWLEAQVNLGYRIDAILRELDMPRSLKEVGVAREKFEDLTINVLEDVCTQTDPGKTKGKEQVLEILEVCA